MPPTPVRRPGSAPFRPGCAPPGVAGDGGLDPRIPERPSPPAAATRRDRPGAGPPPSAAAPGRRCRPAQTRPCGQPPDRRRPAAARGRGPNAPCSQSPRARRAPRGYPPAPAPGTSRRDRRVARTPAQRRDARRAGSRWRPRYVRRHGRAILQPGGAWAGGVLPEGAPSPHVPQGAAARQSARRRVCASPRAAAFPRTAPAVAPRCVATVRAPP